MCKGPTDAIATSSSEGTILEMQRTVVRTQHRGVALYFTTHVTAADLQAVCAQPYVRR